TRQEVNNYERESVNEEQTKMERESCWTKKIKHGGRDIGFQRSHVILPVEEDRGRPMISNMQRHNAHCTLIAVENRPAMGDEDGAQDDGKRENTHNTRSVWVNV